MTVEQAVETVHAHLKRGEPEKAWEVLARAEAEHDHDSLLVTRIRVLYHLARNVEAIELAREALRRPKNHVSTIARLCEALWQLGFPQFGEAGAKEVLTRSDSSLADVLLIGAIVKEGHLPDLRPLYVKRLERMSKVDPAAVPYLVKHFEDSSDSAGAWRALQAGAKRFPNSLAVRAQRAFYSNYRDDVTPADHLRVHKEFGRFIEEAWRPTLRPFPNTPDPHKRIRLGVVSPDFCDHSVTEFLFELLESLDRTQFELFLYFVDGQADATTLHYEAMSDQWRVLDGLTPEELAQEVRRDLPDIVLDVAGLTIGPMVSFLAYRAAPVQATYLGSPSTTGLSRVQYRLVDGITDPLDAPSGSVERLLRLPGPFLCYRPRREMPEVGERKEGPLTFGCLGNPLKFSDHTLRLWCDLLGAVPEARLILSYSHYVVPVVREGVERRLVAAGLPADRLELRPGRRDPSFREVYREIDVAVDTFPYHGTTTTCEATYMGVPSITRAGEMHHSRVGASLLSHLGHPEWVAATDWEFVAKAAALVRDRARLAALRSGLRGELRQSPLGDLDAFRPGFEAALRQVWAEWCHNPR